MFCTIEFGSKALGKNIGMNVLLPKGKGPFPVLYLLHGLSDDFTCWMRFSMVEVKAMDLPLIIVMPDGGRSFYCNDARPMCGAYEDHICKDTIETIDNLFHTIPGRAGRAIAGLSMGGYGATMLAMRHPDLFSVACSHSGAMNFAGKPISKELPGVVEYESTLPKGRYSLYKLASAMAKSKLKIAYRLDCGSTDFLVEQNRQFHAHLEKIGFAHEYEEFPGEHNWEYWNAHIRQTMNFALANMKKK
jgi:putative tributyrin esterase